MDPSVFHTELELREHQRRSRLILWVGFSTFVPAIVFGSFFAFTHRWDLLFADLISASLLVLSLLSLYAGRLNLASTLLVTVFFSGPSLATLRTGGIESPC